MYIHGTVFTYIAFLSFEVTMSRDRPLYLADRITKTPPVEDFT